MSKICNKCGCVNENDNARFCNDCGEKFVVHIEEPKPRIKLREVSPDEDDRDKPRSEEIDTPVFRPDTVNLAKNAMGNDTEPIYEDDDVEEETNEPLVEDEEDFFYEDDEPEKPEFEEPIFEEPVEEPREKRFERKSSVISDEEVTNDPYYDDLLPDIDNEIKAIPRDIFFKVAGAVIILFAAIFYLIMVW